MKKIALASDHAAFPMKNHVQYLLKNKGYEIVDFGTNSEDSVDYPDYGHKLGDYMDKNNSAIGIALCGSGNGMNMAISKHKSTRSAICWNIEITRLARKHNNANVCVIPGRFVTQNEIDEIVDVFLNTKFDGGRHEKRVNKIPIK